MEGVSESGGDSQSSDLLLANIEKFILEYEDNMTTKPLTLTKGKLYDTENLLEILEEKNKVPKRKPSVSVPANPKKLPIVPFKRKLDVTTKSDLPPKKLDSIKPQQKIEVPTRKQSISVLADSKKLPIVSLCKHKLEVTTKSDLPPKKIDSIKPQQKIEVPTRKPSISVLADSKKLPIVPLCKRKLEVTTKSDLPPKKINSIKPQQKIENVVKCATTQPLPLPPIRKRGRPVKRPQELQVQYATTEEIKEFQTAKLMPTKKKASIKTHSCRTHRCKEVFVDVRNDSKIVKNINIKQEIIDLTSEDVSLTLLINYPREEFLPEIKYETCDILQTEKPISIKPFTDLHTATVFKPDVRVHLTKAIIDLTLEEDESSSIIVASEKECAIKILPPLYKFHQAYKLNRLMEGALNEVGETKLNVSTRQTKTIALTLIETLSGLNVKNFKIESFLEFLNYKFNQKYKVSVDRKCLAHYLQSMLVDLNRQHCSNQFVINFAKHVDEIVRIKCEIEESNTRVNLGGYSEEVVFTEKQLEQLVYQIGQYHLIDKYNQYIASSCISCIPPKTDGDYDTNRNQEISTGSIAANNPEIEREIKDEILEINGHRA